jgi:hypothetical protein
LDLANALGVDLRALFHGLDELSATKIGIRLCPRADTEGDDHVEQSSPC